MNGSQSAEEVLLKRLAECGGALGGTVESRWQFLVKRPTTAKIFHLLLERGEMFSAEIARAIGRRSSQVQEAVRPLLSTKIAETEKRGHRLYFNLVPEAVEQYQQLLKSPKTLTPMHIIVLGLLIERGEMYETQILDALRVTISQLQPAIDRLMEAGVIELEYRRDSYGQKFYRVQPEVVEELQQLLASRKAGQPEP